MRCVSLLAALGLSLSVGSAHAEIYSWTDADGVLHFTDVDGTKNGAYLSYSEADVEGFGGQPPMVAVMQDGKKRTLYPVRVSRFDHILREAAEHYKLPVAFLKAVAKVESNFNPRAVSHANAKGLMQIIDSTAASLNVKDPFDPRQSIFGGARYLRKLANMFDGDLALTAAAYNAGPERVRRSGGIPRIDETQRYVARVLTMYKHYSRGG